jgi:predicted membrane-bound dolichyl-phosphate-mannose-protein mannosyltransferase
MALHRSDDLQAAAASAPAEADPARTWTPGALLFRSRVHDAVFLLVLAAASIEFAVLRTHYGLEDHGGAFAKLIAGTGQTPFQYRVLIPLVARGVIALGALAHLNIPPRAIFFASDAGFTFGALVTATVTLKTLSLSRTEILASLVALGAILQTNYFATEILNVLCVYDLPAVFFAFLGTNLLLRSKLRWFYAMLPVALLNRETAVFLCLLFLLVNFGRMPLATLAKHMVLQGAIVLLIKGAVTAAFMHNPGAGGISLYTTDFTATGSAAHRLHDLRLLENLRLFLSPRRLIHMSSIFGFLWIPYLFALRNLSPLSTSKAFFSAAAWLFPPVFALMFVVGNIEEFRIYSELIPILFFTVALYGAQGVRREAVADNPGAMV